MVPRQNQKIAIDEATEGLINQGFHGMLLEMSLGKTKCSLNVAEIMRSYEALDQVMIVCPKAIQNVWVEQLPEHTFIETEPVIWENPKTQKKKREIEGLKSADFPVLIVRLEMFQRDNKVLKTFLDEFLEKPTLVILDESSKIKNVSTQRTPRLIESTRKAAYKLILTGTPWSESPLDIFSQMEFLKNGFWYRYTDPWKKSTLKKHWYIFRNRYAVMQDIRTSEGRSFQTIVGTRRTEEIARKIQGYVTQQKKADWLDLPEKIRQTLHVEMSKEQAKAYNQMRDMLILEHGDEILTAQNAATLLTRLRQIAGGFLPVTGEPIAKRIAGIDTLLEDVDGYPGKVIIAASYVAEIKGIVEALSKEYGSEQVATYYGGTEDRENEVARFKDRAKFLVLNPQSGAYGLNLQFASLMYLYSRPFSYEQNMQLEDRIHRPGMTGSAVYKDIVHVGTVQEKVIKAIEKKKDVVSEFDRLTVKDFLTNG
jgi:SNF2 family DNA or RNA helicase